MRKGPGIAGIGAHLDEGLSAIGTTAEKIDLVSSPGPDVGHFRTATEQLVANRDLKGLTGIGLLTANEGRGRVVVDGADLSRIDLLPLFRIGLELRDAEERRRVSEESAEHPAKGP